jgi:hypothetical protein
MSRHQVFTIGGHQREQRSVDARAAVAQLTHPLDGVAQRGHGVRQLRALTCASGSRKLAQEDEKHHFTVGLAHHEAPQPLIHELEQGKAQLLEARNVSVVGKHPAPVLKRMTIEDSLVTLGGLAHVGQHRLRSHHAAQPMKQRVAQRCAGAAGHVRSAVDVKRDTPSIRMLIALHAERVLGGQQGSVDLAGDHAAKAEETAHGRDQHSAPRPTPAISA